MRLRIVVLALIAFGAAGSAVFLAQDWLQAQKDALNAQLAARQSEPETVMEVLVAAENLPRGTFIKDSHLVWQIWPEDGISERYIVREGESVPAAAEQLVGAVVRNGLTEGEPITEGRIVRPGDRGFLAAVLRPGMRAVSVPVSATAGVAGFVFPGDRVDLILTHEIQRSGESVTHRASETLLRDVRVLAVDQSVDDQNGTPRVAKTATLEVSPKQAEIITVSMQIGRLSLVLRSLGVEDDKPKIVEQRTHTWDSQASRLLEGFSGDSGPSVVVFRREEKQRVKFGGASQ